MGFWPFGGGKRQRVVEVEEHGRETLLKRAPSGRGAAQQEKHGQEASRLQRAGSKTAKEEMNARRLSKTRSFGSKPTSYAPPPRSQTTPVQSIEDNQRTSRTNSQYDEKALYQQNPLSQTSLGPENFTVIRGPPTLHAKRSENDTNVPRRKSSKRKAEDFAREREIRAMSSSPIPIPKRPATLYGSGILQRDSRQVPGPLNRRLERPTSEISLPLPGSLSDIAGFPNQNSFKVSMLAALSPRPTVRYDANARYANGKQPVRPNMAIRQAIAEEDVSDKKRIDELADDLDAGGLRELMERDRRRKERKKDADKAKLQRKLQRRAERQREEEAARRARTEAFVQAVPADASRYNGLGIESSSGLQNTSIRQIQSTDVETDPFVDPAPLDPSVRNSIPNPFEDEKDADFMQDPHDTEDETEVTEGIPIPVRSPLRDAHLGDNIPRPKQSQSTLSPPVSPVNRAVDRSSLSQGSFMHRETTLDATENASIERRTSDQSSLRLSSWTSFFKRGTRRKFAGPSQGRATPSEFSNTSRESFSRKQPPVVSSRTFRRSDSATPQRTMSRFREDLPELPISPPDSRMQSPEAATAPVGNVLSASVHRDAAPSNRDSVGVQGDDRTDVQPQQRSADLDVPLSPPKGVILSQSLASVDSEGSWLSGKPSKRQSGQLSHALRPSQSSVPRQMPGTFNEGDIVDVDDDDGRQGIAGELAVGDSRNSQQIGQDSFEGPARNPETDAPQHVRDEEWNSDLGKQATLARQAGRTKSKEGLLDEHSTAENSNSSSEEGGDDPDSSSNEAEVKSPILRARSVDYKGHIRHISAGSAKLLDVKRSSTHSDLSRPATAARKSDLALTTESTSSTPKL